MRRCEWAVSDLMIAYHDREWGVPVHDDRTLFEFLTLEGAQAGLSWEIVLKKRDAYRLAFDNFDINKIAAYGSEKVSELLVNPGIIRNRLKILSTIGNARAALEIIEEFGSLDGYLWAFVGGQPLVNSPATLRDIPVKTEISEVMSKDLRKRGLKFVGSTICYAFMQAVGLVNDHTIDCFRHPSAADGR